MIKKVKYSLTDLENCSDEDLMPLIYDKASELYLGTFGENLNKADKALGEFLAVCILESEVHNGGFDQFFLNNGLDYGIIALSGLKNIGAEKYADITQRAIDIYKNQSLEFDKKRNPDFEVLDDDFYDLENLHEFQITHIRNNYEKYVVK